MNSFYEDERCSGMYTQDMGSGAGATGADAGLKTAVFSAPGLLEKKKQVQAKIERIVPGI
jgi:hypothetical protein